MAIAALNSAATGLRALSTRIDVIANNLSNAESTAFKEQRVNFEDLMYVTLKQPGATSASGDVTPAGIFVGLGTKISNTQLDMTQGSPESTNSPLDVAIQGPGFFRVKVLPTLGDGTAYTRNGNFIVNNNGELVVNVGDGYRLDPPVTVPKNATDITITTDGEIDATIAGKTQKTKVGNLQLTTFINPQGLNLLGSGLYQETDSSGQPITGNAGENGTGQILQNYLETSNVDPVKELVSLIKTQRSFELNSQSIQTADQALQTIGNLRRS
ncbi:MAG: flagellar basal-body rod protein FlgG [Phycisphaerae bacterium]|nr:flagellar basal-body rod protein FlgG [Phycisphaerae bacterium]